MATSKSLDLINNQLKDEGKKFKLVVYRNKYQIRGTFKFSNGKKKRAYISLDLAAEEGSLREAKKRCDMISYRYEDVGFIPDVLPFEKVVAVSSGTNQIKVKDAKELFIEDWWNKRSIYEWWLDPDYEKEQNGSNRGKYKNKNESWFKPPTVQMLKDLRSWRGITPYINHLDSIEDSYLTVGALYQIAKSSYAVNTRGRREIVIRFQRLIKLCKQQNFDIGGDSFDLEDLKGKYKPKTKSNFTEEDLYKIILVLREKMPRWKWCWGALYVWGCRPSEVFNLVPNTGEAYGTANVLGLKEEGEGFEERTSLGDPEKLIKEFDLLNIDRPYEFNSSDKSYDPVKSKEFTDSWGKALRRVINNNDDLPKFLLYDIRHAYARRLIKKNIPTATCALSMGHDERIFKETYLKAINKKDMTDIQKLL